MMTRPRGSVGENLVSFALDKMRAKVAWEKDDVLYRTWSNAPINSHKDIVNSQNIATSEHLPEWGLFYGTPGARS